MGKPEPAARSNTGYARRYLDESRAILDLLNPDELDEMAGALATLRERGGRLFVLGVGGGSANASHAVNDFRKLTGIEAYTPTDNVAELTARINDEGWEGAFVGYLRGSRLGAKDGVFVFSVGGGSEEKAISVNIVNALRQAREAGATIFGVVGRDGGYTARVGDHCIVVTSVNAERVTPHTESFQSLILHLLVSHPALAVAKGKWETVEPAPQSASGPDSE